MKKLFLNSASFITGALVLASCSTSQMASTGAQDNLYYMASDAKVATEFAVQNNTPTQFQSLTSETEAVPQESFSSRNVNPDYLARYQSETPEASDDVIYFDENSQESNPDINAYNNYRVNGNSYGNGSGSSFNSNLSFNLGFGMGYSMMYGAAMNPWMYPNYYDPFYGPRYGYGYRPGFNMSIGFGFGGYYPPMYGGGYGMYPGYGYPGYGYPGYGYGGYPVYPRNPIYILPGGEYGGRGVVTGVRPSRGASLTSSGVGTRNTSITNQAGTSRAQARQEVASGNNSARRMVSKSNPRVTSRDFGTSQNDIYNGRARTSTTTRNVSSAASSRPVSRTRSAMPSSRPSYSTRPTSTDTRSTNTYQRGGSVNNSAPSYRRSTTPTRNVSPSYNRGNTTPTRTTTPSRVTPTTRSSTPSYTPPARSNTGAGTVTRSTSTGSRGGRGNN